MLRLRIALCAFGKALLLAVCVWVSATLTGAILGIILWVLLGVTAMPHIVAVPMGPLTWYCAALSLTGLLIMVIGGVIGSWPRCKEKILSRRGSTS